MAALKGVNNTIEVSVPDTKTDPNSVRGKLSVIREKYSIAGVVSNGDTIEGPLIPDGARIVDAQLIVKASTGAGGQFRLGLRAGNLRGGAELAEDADALLVNVVDAGGQAAQGSMEANAAGRDLVAGEGGLRTFATCYEDTDDLSATPVDLFWYVTVMMV